MKVKNFVVGSVIELERISKSDSKTVVIPNRILETAGEDTYFDLENRKYYKNNNGKIDQVDMDTFIPLSNYYNILGLKKKNNHENKEIVYEKINKIKRIWGKL